MNSYLKQIIHTQFFNVLNIIFGLATLLILIKYLKVTQYAEYVLIQGLIATGALIFSQNIYAYTRLRIPGAEISVQYGYLKTVIIIVFVFYFEIIILGKILNFEYIIFDFFEIERDLSNLVLIILAFELLNFEIMRYFIAIKKIYLKNYAQFYQKLFVFSGCFCLLYLHSINLKEFLYLYISGQLFVLLMFIRDINIPMFLTSCFMEDVLQRGYTVAFPLLPVGLMSIALNYTDTLMIAKFIDKEHVAQYGFASQIISIVMMMIGTSIVLTLFPYATHAHNNKNITLRTDFFIKMYKLGIYSSLFFYLLSTANVYFVIQILNLKNYNEVPYYLSVLAIFPLFQLIYNVSSHHLQLMNVLKIQFVIALLVITENFILNYFMVQAYGVMGSAFASLLAFITLSLCYFILSLHYDNQLLEKIKKIRYSSLLIFFIVIGTCFSFYHFNMYKNIRAVLTFDLLIIICTIISFKLKIISVR